MKTLDEHLDALDAMVANHATTPEIRSQIAFIQREVAALEADYVRLSDAHAKIQSEHSKLKEAESARNRKAFDSLNKKAEDYQKLLRSKELKYDA